MGKLLTLTPVRDSLPAEAGLFLRKFKAVGKKEEGNAAVSDSSLLERVAAVTEDSHVTLDVGLASEQLVRRMNAKSSFPPNRRSVTPIWHYPKNRRITC